MILSCSNISKSFGTDSILNHVSFHIEEREKAAVVGINGAGKSTLLKIIVGELAPDEGSVVIAKGKTLGYLAQHQDLDSGRTIYDELLEVKRPIIEMEERLRTLEVNMKRSQGEELESLYQTYSRLSHEFELANGYAWKSEITGDWDFWRRNFQSLSPPSPAARKPAFPWENCSCPSRILFFWTSPPTTWTWSPSPGSKIIS